MCILKLTLGKIIFLQIFPLFSTSNVKRPDEPVLESGHLRLCRSMIWQYAVRTSVYHFRTRALCFLCHSHIIAFFILCFVSLVDFFWDFGILCTSLLIPLYSLCFPMFFYVVMPFRIMEIFLRYCALKTYSVYVLGWYWYTCDIWIAIFSYIFFFSIQLTAIIIPHFFELTRYNLFLCGGIFGNIFV